MTKEYKPTEEYQPLTLLQFGIELRRMVEADKEIIRQGRNTDFVRKNHVYKEIITEAEHEKWFNEMNGKQHYVFVIIRQGRRVGVVYLRNVPENLASSSSGVFIWDEEFIATGVPVFAALLALDFASYYCQVKLIDSIVLKNNAAAIKMYTFFGFTFEERDADSYYIYIPRETYVAKRDKLINFVKRAVKNKDEHQLRISGSICSLNHDIVNDLLAKMSS